MTGVVKRRPTYLRLRSHFCEKSHRVSVPHLRQNMGQTRCCDLRISYPKVSNSDGPRQQKRTLIILANAWQVDALLHTNTF